MGNCQQCLIKKLNNLDKLNKEELQCVSASKKILFYQKGDIILKEGKFNHGVYCLKSGACKVSKIDSNGKEQIVNFSKTGDLIGYQDLVTHEANQMDVTAISDLELCYIPKELIISFIESNYTFSKDLFKTVCKDLKTANLNMVNMSTKTVEQRIAELLLFLNESYGVDNNNKLKIKLSRNEIASTVGTATESAIRILSKFKKNELIKLDKKDIILIDIKGLKEIANF